MKFHRGWFAPLGAAWIALVPGTAYLRPLWPIDETRYLAVAWEMWVRGDFLVPYLNGVPYSDKPPLLFWLFHLGWTVFGVNEWWPRLVPPLFALAGVALTVRLARRLWPERPGCAPAAAWILFGSLFWAAFMTFTMFDLLIVCFTLLAMLGLIDAWRSHASRGFALFAAAIGLGLLSKGPAILAHVLPAALAAPWWMGARRRIGLGAWYGGVAAAFAGGAVLALGWAVPAAVAGGAEYRTAILWSQTAGRVVSSFAHQHSWWWYLPMLPFMFFPWIVWPPLWRGLRRIPVDAGVRFVFAWMAPAFVIFSWVSGKQPHYLLPLFPAFALVAAFVFHAAPDGDTRWFDRFPPALLVIGVGVGWLLVAFGRSPVPLDIRLSALPGAASIIVALAMLVGLGSSRDRQIRRLAAVSIFLVVVVSASLARTLGPSYDLRPMAAYLAALERSNVPVAHVGKYHGQFQFLGRLRWPIDVVEANELCDWVRRHPRGRVITYQRSVPGGSIDDETGAHWGTRDVTPEYTQPYRGGRLYVWSCGAILGG